MDKFKPRIQQAGCAVILLHLAILGSPARVAAACSLTIHVDGFRNTKGVLGGALFKNKTGWPEDGSQAFARDAIPVPANSAAVLTFPEVPVGQYAVAVLHDENENHRLDRNILRLPKEGFGFANNPHVGLSAPSWNDSSVQVACPSTEVHIHLIYK